MQSFRRAALSATRVATRSVAPKSQASSVPAQLARSSALKTASILVVARPFSQSTRVAFDEDGQGSSGAAEPLRAPRFRHKDNETEFGIFVRNIAFDTTEADLGEIFGKYGEVANTIIGRDARGISRGYAFVYYNNAKDMAEALAQAEGSFHRGRRLSCTPRVPRVANRQSPREPTKSLYIGNIPYEATDAEFNRLFEDMPNLRDVRVAIDRTTGWPRGFAHADFYDVESAEKAKERLYGVKLGDRELRIDFADPAPKDRQRGGSQRRERTPNAPEAE